MSDIILIDAFITNEINEKKLSDFINRIKTIDLPILLISNTIISEKIVNKVNYYIYDSENRLFDDVFEEYEKFILWEVLNDIRFNTLYEHKQKHALSVMVNLFNGITFAKSIGYKNFHRIEYDTILGDDTINFIRKISEKTNEKGKEGYFFLNKKNKTQKFQYFYSNIDFFLKTIPLIKNQNDYLNLLIRLYDSKKFVHIERVMYDLIKDNNDIILTFNDGEEINDSIWNTETSLVHIEDKYKSCRTTLYRGEDGNIILSKNNIKFDTKRKIILFKNGIEIDFIIHQLKGLNEYVFNYISKDIDNIIIIENNLVIDNLIVKNQENFYEK
jgi:hypothetical protein